MSESDATVLLVDPDSRSRTLLAAQLRTTTPNVLEAGDAGTAMALVHSTDVRVVVAEMYLSTGDFACLIQAIRNDKTLRNTRTVALTHRSTPADREWAMTAGADAYLIKPTRAERLRYVVSRLATARGRNANVPARTTRNIVRRDTLDAALAELEAGKLAGTSCIVFGRTWWQALNKAQQASFRRRAKKLHVSLRSDSLMNNHFVEVRGETRQEIGLSSEQPESPYRR